MAIPRFSFGSGASGLYNPNQILVPTTLTSADKTQLLDYDKKIADYKAQVDAYNKAVEAHNKSGKGTFSQKEPTDPGITQKEIDTFGAESAARAQQLQTARQNALNILQNPEGFSSYYGIGSLGFGGGGDVPFFLEAEPTRSKVPSQEELTKSLLRYFPVLQLLNKTSKIYTELVPDIIKTSVRMAKNPESKEEESKDLDFRVKNRADSILNMFGTSTEELMPRDKEPVYKTEFEDGGAVSEGIGSLMQDNRYQEAKVFDLDYAEDAERYNSREELEQLNPSFMVGRYNIRPNISGSYNMSSVDIPENVDGKNVFINKRDKSGGGNLGFNVTTPNRHNFGANVSGNYFTGSTENPEELQAFGAPAKINYGEGLTPQNYYAYYKTPEGLSISGNYREGNPDQKSALEIMLSKQIKFKNVEDLTKRIERFLKRR
jgi:hypothetical protein